VLLGEAELDRWPPAEVQRLIGQHGALPLTDLSALHAQLAPAALFLGNDSGPTHLAAQVGLPTLALFGPTDPQRWRPVGPAVTVLAPPRPGPMTWLEPSMVVAALGAMLAPLGPQHAA
jgi:ADP-heptose:LPS heptosyltransferase